MKIIFLIIIVFLHLVLFTSCKEEIVGPTEFKTINVDVRMEVQILDSTFQIYSRPHTKIYFTTYKLIDGVTKSNLLKSDTTSCPNGWGVKLLNFDIKGEDEKIVLGAACENYNGNNYREVIIDYDEAVRRVDTLGHASINKTFAIYYK